MMQFQSQASNPPPGSSNNNSNQGELISLISSLQSPIWLNPSASSLGILLELSGIDPSLVNNPQAMSDIQDWESMDVCCLRPSDNNSAVHPNEEFRILDAFVEKCSGPEDSRPNVDPPGGLPPQVARSKPDPAFPRFEIDPRPPKRRGLPKPEISQREYHIQSERQRRRGMNHLFDAMRSLLPNPIRKTDKSTIVAEMINYIQSLQQQLQDLSDKRERMLWSPREIPRIKSEQSPAESIQSECTAANSPVSSTASGNEERATQTSHFTLHFHGNDAFITMSCGKKSNLLGAILFVLEDHNLQVIHANVSTTDSMAFHCFHVKALESPDLGAREALKCALQKFLS